MRTSQAHIAGVGLAVSRESNDSLDKLAISAATKALLDAGVIYGEVDECLACFDHDLRIPPSSFDTLGMQGAPICEVNNSFGLNAAAQSVWSRRANCSLVVGIDGVSLLNSRQRLSDEADPLRGCKQQGQSTGNFLRSVNGIIILTPGRAL